MYLNQCCPTFFFSFEPELWPPTQAAGLFQKLRKNSIKIHWWDGSNIMVDTLYSLLIYSGFCLQRICDSKFFEINYYETYELICIQYYDKQHDSLFVQEILPHIKYIMNWQSKYKHRNDKNIATITRLLLCLLFLSKKRTQTPVDFVISATFFSFFSRKLSNELFNA